MAEESVFEKIHVDERDKADLGGVLEQLNLPPQVVKFVRKHQRTIYIVLAVVAITVVTWALYDGHVKKQRKESNAALYTATTLSGDDKQAALKRVVGEYSGLDAGKWAEIKLAQAAMENKNYSEAAQLYGTLQQLLDSSDLLYPLVSYSLAEAFEQLEKYDDAIANYSLLKSTSGYEQIAYLAMARVEEKRGRLEQAVKELEEYLGTTIGSSIDSEEKRYVNATITRLKAAM